MFLFENLSRCYFSVVNRNWILSLNKINRRSLRKYEVHLFLMYIVYCAGHLAKFYNWWNSKWRQTKDNRKYNKILPLQILLAKKKIIKKIFTRFAKKKDCGSHKFPTNKPFLNCDNYNNGFVKCRNVL